MHGLAALASAWLTANETD